ncbi:MAG: response regulator [Candidatus Falkowbacteria bacterium]
MSKKIFIIEDEESILYGLQDHFTSDGYDIEISAADEEMEDLLGRIKKFKPSYVILDLVLPKLDGADILKRIKSDDETSDIQVLIFTDLSDEDSKTRSVGLGANYYFLKSEMDITEFADHVEKIMENKQVSDISADDAEENDLVLE